MHFILASIIPQCGISFTFMQIRLDVYVLASITTKIPGSGVYTFQKMGLFFWDMVGIDSLSTMGVDARWGWKVKRLMETGRSSSAPWCKGVSRLPPKQWEF